jgi:hypothetical protein
MKRKLLAIVIIVLLSNPASSAPVKDSSKAKSVAPISAPELPLVPLAIRGVGIDANTETLMEGFSGMKCYENGERFRVLGKWSCSMTRKYDGACKGDMATSDICRNRYKIGPAYTDLITVAMSKSDQMNSMQILFSEDQFSAMRAALTEKFGKPASIVPAKLQNRMGATFESVTITWTQPNGYLELVQRDSKIDQSALQLKSNRGLKEFEQLTSEAAKTTAKDL